MLEVLIELGACVCLVRPLINARKEVVVMAAVQIGNIFH